MKTILCFLTALSLASCYTVRVTNRDALFTQKPPEGDGFYVDKVVHTLDTVIKTRAWEEFWLQEKPCNDCGFYSLEYRNTLGASLRYALSLGSRRAIHIRYVCATR
jgi:hypothetical protein